MSLNSLSINKNMNVRNLQVTSILTYFKEYPSARTCPVAFDYNSDKRVVFLSTTTCNASLE